MKKDYNLYEFAKLIERACQAHPLVNDFLFSVYRINDTDNITYPVVALTLNSVTKRQNTIDFNINLLYADRLTDNRDNVLTAQSEGVTVLLEMMNVLSTHTNTLVPDDYQITPFKEQFADNTAGAFVAATIKAPNYLGECFYFDPECIEC